MNDEPSPNHSLERDFMLPQNASHAVGLWKAMAVDTPLALAGELARFSAARLEAQARWLAALRDARDPSDVWQITLDHVRLSVEACGGEAGKILAGGTAIRTDEAA